MKGEITIAILSPLLRPRSSNSKIRATDRIINSFASMTKINLFFVNKFFTASSCFFEGWNISVSTTLHGYVQFIHSYLWLNNNTIYDL